MLLQGKCQGCITTTTHNARTYMYMRSSYAVVCISSKFTDNAFVIHNMRGMSVVCICRKLGTCCMNGACTKGLSFRQRFAVLHIRCQCLLPCVCVVNPGKNNIMEIMLSTNEKEVTLTTTRPTTKKICGHRHVFGFVVSSSRNGSMKESDAKVVNVLTEMQAQ